MSEVISYLVGKCGYTQEEAERIAASIEKAALDVAVYADSLPLWWTGTPRKIGDHVGMCPECGTPILSFCDDTCKVSSVVIQEKCTNGSDGLLSG